QRGWQTLQKVLAGGILRQELPTQDSLGAQTRLSASQRSYSRLSSASRSFNSLCRFSLFFRSFHPPSSLSFSPPPACRGTQNASVSGSRDTARAKSAVGRSCS